MSVPAAVGSSCSGSVVGGGLVPDLLCLSVLQDSGIACAESERRVAVAIIVIRHLHMNVEMDIL